MPSEDTYFKPGKSGNPGGVPKGKRISTWMVELGRLDSLPDPSTLPINGQIALKMLRNALEDGGERATEIILDRTEDKLPETQINFISPDSRAAIIAKGRALGRPIEPTATA